MGGTSSEPRRVEVQVAGVRTRYLEAGSGLPVVFVHGFGAGGAYWSQNIGALPPGFRGIAPDLAGHGESGIPDARYDIGYYEGFLVGFLDVLGLERVILVGSSMGGLLAARLAIDHPARVERLVLCDSAGLNRGLPLSTGLLYLPGLIKQLFLAPSPESVRRWFTRATFHDSSRIPDELVDLSVRSRRTFAARKVLFKTALGLTRPEARVLDRLGEVRVPALLIWGADDRQLPVSNANDAVKMMKRCTVEVIERCGHIPMVERPEEFNRVVNEFLLKEFPGTAQK